jgi:hypothetical protein
VNQWNAFWNLVQLGITVVWQAIVSWVTGVVTSFVSWIISAWNGFISFWSGLWNGIRTTVQDIWNGIISWFQGIPGMIQNVFSGAIGWLTSAGRDILQGLWNGLKGIWESISSWISNTVGGIADTVAGLFGIASPSKLFTYFGEMMTAGLVEGLKGMEVAATRQLKVQLQPVTDMMDQNPVKYKDTTSHMGSTTVNNNREQRIEAGAFAFSGPDPYRAAREVQNAIAEEASL